MHGCKKAQNFTFKLLSEENISKKYSDTVIIEKCGVLTPLSNKIKNLDCVTDQMHVTFLLNDHQINSRHRSWYWIVFRSFMFISVEKGHKINWMGLCNNRNFEKMSNSWHTRLFFKIFLLKIFFNVKLSSMSWDFSF